MNQRKPAVRTYDITRMRPWFRHETNSNRCRFGEESYFMQGDPRPGDLILLAIPAGAQPSQYRVVKFKRINETESWVCQAEFAETH